MPNQSSTMLSAAGSAASGHRTYARRVGSIEDVLKTTEP